MSSAPLPPPPPPPPGPPMMASASKQSKKAGQNRSLLLSDIQKGARLKSSKHLMNDRSGLVIATNGKTSQNNGTGGGVGGFGGSGGGGTGDSVGVGKTNRGPPNLGDLFAGGIPKLKSTVSNRQSESAESPEGVKRKSQIGRAISQDEVQRMKRAEQPTINNDTNHVLNMVQRRTSTGTLRKPPVPGNKPALPGPKPSLSFSQRASTSNLSATEKPIPESQPVLCQPAKPPAPPAKPLHMQNHSRDSQTIGRKCRPVSCAPAFSDSLESTSFLNMAESPFAFPVPRPSVAGPAKAAKRPQSTFVGAQTLSHSKSDRIRMCSRPLNTPPPLPKKETNGPSVTNSSEDATDSSFVMVSPSTSMVNGSSEARSKVRKRQSRSSVAEQPSLSSLSVASYDTDFEAQFRFHREKELPAPDTFKESHKTYPSKNPKNPAYRGSSDVW